MKTVGFRTAVHVVHSGFLALLGSDSMQYLNVNVVIYPRKH